MNLPATYSKERNERKLIKVHKTHMKKTQLKWGEQQPPRQSI